MMEQIKGKTGYRILMFPQRTYPSDHAMLETVYTHLLPQRGHQVIWVMRRGPSSPRHAEADWNGAPVYLLSNHKQSLLTQPLNWVFRAYQSYRIACAVAVQSPIDIVQVRNELTSAFVALILKKKWGIPFVYQRSFPTVEANHWLPTANRATDFFRNIVLWLGRTLQWWLLCQADLVLAISDQMRAEMVMQGLPEDKVISFPLGVDADIQPENYDRNMVRSGLALGDSPTVIYFGAMDRLRRLDFLLDVMVLVLDEMPSAKLLMVGSALKDDEYQWLKNESTLRGLDQAIRFVGSVSRLNVPWYLSAADVSVVPIPPTPIYTVSSPTKVLESLGMSVPVVANSEIPDQFKVITESGGGECVPYNVPAFAAAILRFLKDISMSQLAGQQGRKYVIRERSYSKLADDIHIQYSKLLAKNQKYLN